MTIKKEEELKTTGVFIKVSNFLFGDFINFSLENRIFNASSLITFLAAFCSLIVNLYSGYGLISNLVYIGFIIAFIILYYFGRVKKICKGFSYFLLAITAISFLWFINEGINGTVPLILVVAILIFASVTQTKHHFFVLGITIVYIIGLVIAENYFLQDYLIKFPSQEIKELQLAFGLLLSVLVVFIFAHILKKNFIRENETIRKQEKELSELNATKDLLFSIISHDLRSPFNGIIGASELMCDDSRNLSDEKIKYYANQINQLSKNTYKLLDNLLNWSYLNQGTILFKPENLDLYDLINDGTCISTEIAEKKNIELIVNIDKDINISADKNMFQLIIRNLFSNAVKYTKSGGSVFISAKKKNTEIEIMVKDTGIGMSTEIIDGLFNIEKQVVRKGTNNEPSFGIGLILAKNFIEKHNGKLNIESKPEEGSQFSFTIPQK